MDQSIGKKIWVFPDGDLPPAGDYELKGHESVIVLNTNTQPAEIRLTLYFEDRPPVCDIDVRVEGKRVRCLRMDNPNDVDGFKVTRQEQYAIVLQSSVPVIVQYGRLDTHDQPMNFYTNTGYFE